MKFNNEQNFNSMEKIWGDLVDQVAFVNYNSWENSYNKPPNGIVEPCSDLWRRMFIWWDGKCNPCDVDYKSSLSILLWCRPPAKGSFSHDLITDKISPSSIKRAPRDKTLALLCSLDSFTISLGPL